MKPFRSIRFVVAIACAFGSSHLFAQDVVDLSGTVLGADGKPVQGVAVTLDESGLSDTTKADGTWKIQGDIVATRPRLATVRSMRWLGSDLVTQFDAPTLVHADLFDAAGRRLAVLPSTVVDAGMQSIHLDLPRFSGARWLRVVANGTPTVLSARSGVSAPGIALPRSLAARASENILIYSLQGQIITEDKLDKLIAANLLQYIKSYTISAKMVFDPRVKVDSAWAWFTGGTMTSPLRARMGFDDINHKITGTVYTVRPKDAFATYSFKTWLNIHGNGNRLTAVSDTIKFTTDFGIIEWAREFNSSNAFPDGRIVSIDSVEVGTDLDLSVAMAWQDTATHRVRDSVIRAEWDLADGKGWRLANELPPVAKARWNRAGIDTVKLRLMDVDSNVAVIVKAIKVVNSGASLKFNGPTDTTITPSDTVAFRLTVRDTSGVARVIWSYGDGKSDTTATGEAHAVKHAYPDYRVVGAGKDSTFTLTVTVVDSLGGSSKHEVARVKVVNTVLSGQLTFPEQPASGTQVNIVIPYQVSITPANKLVAHAEWDLGDGQGWRAGSATSYQAKWLKPGSYAVKVRLTDKDSNRVVVVAKSITIINTKTTVTIDSIIDSALMKPGSILALHPQEGLVGTVTPSDTVVFTLKMIDPSGVAKVLWDFGDGTIDSTGAGATQVIRHPYPGPDVVPPNTATRFFLSLTAIDSLGDTTKLPKFLKVKDTNDVPVMIPLPDTFSYVDSTYWPKINIAQLDRIKYEWSIDGGTPNWGDKVSVTTSKAPNTIYTLVVRVIDEDNNTSLSDTSTITVYGVLVDSRDGVERRYKTIIIDGINWMAENLNLSTPKHSCHEDDDAECSKYGRLYSWADAMGFDDSCNAKSCADQIDPMHQGICPAGWRIPTNADWISLETFVEQDPRVGAGKCGWALRSRDQPICATCKAGGDIFGFNAITAQYPYGTVASFWSASENGVAAWYRAVNEKYDSLYHGSYSSRENYKASGTSIRCIKN